jgi:hypothetical protein
VAPCKAANGFGGKIHSFCDVTPCTVGTAVASGNLGPQAAAPLCYGTGGVNSADNMIMDSPIIDSTNGTIYVVVAQDGSTSPGHSAIYQFSEGYAAASCGVQVTLGTGSTTGASVFDGQFNNKYYNNAGEASPFMYVCGNAGGSPTLYQIAVTSAGIMTAGAGTAGPALTNTTTPCSPITEFYNNSSADYLFMSMQATGTTAPASCTASSTGCIVSFNLLATGFTFSTGLLPTASTNAAGGTSGISVDNDGSGGGSQIYFTPLSTTVQNCTTTGQQGVGGCAIQAAQSTLGE